VQYPYKDIRNTGVAEEIIRVNENGQRMTEIKRIEVSEIRR